MDKSIFEKIGLQLPEPENLNVTDAIPTGVLPLDIALGIGGFARGRFVGLGGLQSTGKSTLAVNLAKHNILAGGTSIIFDTEAVYERSRLLQLGVSEDIIDGDKLIVINNWGIDKKTKELSLLTIETICYWVVKLLKATKPEDKLLIVWDTISGTPVDKELDMNFDHEKLMGKHARELSYFFRQIPSLLLQANATMLGIVQPKIDPMSGATSYLGERVVKFHSSQIVMLRKYAQDENRLVVNAEIVKNKVATAYKKVQLVYLVKAGKFDGISNLPEFVKGYGYSFGKTFVKVKKDFMTIFRQEKEGVEKWVMSKLERPIPYVLYPTDDILVTSNDDDEESDVSATPLFKTEPVED